MEALASGDPGAGVLRCWLRCGRTRDTQGPLVLPEPAPTLSGNYFRWSCDHRGHWMLLAALPYLSLSPGQRILEASIITDTKAAPNSGVPRAWLCGRAGTMGGMENQTVWCASLGTRESQFSRALLSLTPFCHQQPQGAHSEECVGVQLSSPTAWLGPDCSAWEPRWSLQHSSSSQIGTREGVAYTPRRHGLLGSPNLMALVWIFIPSCGYYFPSCGCHQQNICISATRGTCSRHEVIKDQEPTLIRFHEPHAPYTSICWAPPWPSWALASSSSP